MSGFESRHAILNFAKVNRYTVSSDGLNIVERSPSGLSTPLKRIDEKRIAWHAISNHRTVTLSIHLPEMPEMSNMSKMDK